MGSVRVDGTSTLGAVGTDNRPECANDGNCNGEEQDRHFKPGP
jgi:hypothetical protein